MDNDTISRQAAIAKLFNELVVLDELPSIRPKTGRWIDDNCSECGQYVYHGDANNYCPNCGAYMKGENNDQTASN